MFKQLDPLMSKKSLIYLAAFVILLPTAVSAVVPTTSPMTQNDGKDSLRIITFDELRANYATDSPITDSIAIKGIVVSNKEQGNAGQPLNKSYNKIDYSPTSKTIYFESEDAKYGIVIYANHSAENTFKQFDRVTLLLTGTTLSVNENGPRRYELTGFSPSLVLSQVPGTDAPVKERTIGTLTDDDLYTYIKLVDVELPIRKGSLFPVEGTLYNASNTHCVTKYPLLVRDRNGDDIYMFTNATCTYHRDGTRLPYGSGNLYGVVVHEHFSRYEWKGGLKEKFYNDATIEKVGEDIGNIGRYQLRHQTKDDIWKDMNDDFEKGFSALLCEYRYRVIRYIGDDKKLKNMGDSIDVPSYGHNGWMTHTYQKKYSGSSKKSWSAKGDTHISSNVTYDYLGPIGRSSSYMYGKNYGNRNGLGIIVDPNRETVFYRRSRFATNDDGKTEFACQYSKNKSCGYGPAGWKESYKDTFIEDYKNVPNGGNSDKTAGNGRIQAGAYVTYSNGNWWDYDTGSPYGYLVNFSTVGISSNIVSMQIYIRAINAEGYTPRYWCAEWSLTDPVYGADVKWNPIGDFTVPDASMNKGNQQPEQTNIWSLPAGKPINFKLPTNILGHENVYVRIRPTSDKCSAPNEDYDNLRLSDTDGGHYVTMTYFAIRYNKQSH